jgi:methionyl aminopeptidase
MPELITGVKTPTQLDAMREGGKILARIFDDIRGFVHAGLSEKEVDDFVAQKITEYGASATYKTSEVNFPGVICISTNDEIVHGIPGQSCCEYSLIN